MADDGTGLLDVLYGGTLVSDSTLTSPAEIDSEFALAGTVSIPDGDLVVGSGTIVSGAQLSGNGSLEVTGDIGSTENGQLRAASGNILVEPGPSFVCSNQSFIGSVTEIGGVLCLSTSPPPTDQSRSPRESRRSTTE